jgi:DNA modification methylase
MDRQFLLVHGNGAAMAEVADGAADLIVTSPPYFSAETEAILKRGGQHSRRDLDTIRAQLAAFAVTLRPIFAEMRRVLGEGRACVIQTKDLRVGEFLLELADIHRDMAEAVGLHLCSRVVWERPWNRRFGSRRRDLVDRARQVRGFRADDIEEFLVFSDEHGLAEREVPVELTEDQLNDAVTPLWLLSASAGPRPHPYPSPSAVLRRLIALLTAPGDLVVDPFAGHATVLRLAVRMGRRAIGYEIDRECAATAERLLALAANKAGRR